MKLKETKTNFFVSTRPTPSVFCFSFISPSAQHETKLTVSAEVGGVSTAHDVDGSFPYIPSTAMADETKMMSIAMAAIAAVTATISAVVVMHRRKKAKDDNTPVIVTYFS
jgi:hypothetical protein